MLAGVHLQPGFLLRSQLMPEFRRAAEREGISLTQWLVRAGRDKLGQAEARHDVTSSDGQVPVGDGH